MLHVYYGTDRSGVRDAATQYIEQKKSPDGTLTVFDAAEYQSGQIADALGAASLFGGAEWYLLDTPSNNAEMAEEVEGSLAAMAESGNTFIVLEAGLLAAAKKKYASHAEAVQEFAAKKTERLNPFALADALANKDRRKLWVLLQEMKLGGLPAEELIGILWWQLKTLRLAAITSSAEEAGLKEFPYSKAKRSLSAFSPGELERLSHSLLRLYHDGHSGVRDIDTALEKWVLSGK